MPHSLPVGMRCEGAGPPLQYQQVGSVALCGAWGGGYVYIPAQSASWGEVLGSTSLAGTTFSAAETQVVAAPNFPFPWLPKPEPHGQCPSPRGYLLSASLGGGQCTQQSVPSWVLLVEALH